MANEEETLAVTNNSNNTAMATDLINNSPRKDSQQ